MSLAKRVSLHLEQIRKSQHRFTHTKRGSNNLLHENKSHIALPFIWKSITRVGSSYLSTQYSRGVTILYFFFVFKDLDERDRIWTMDTALSTFLKSYIFLREISSKESYFFDESSFFSPPSPSVLLPPKKNKASSKIRRNKNMSSIEIFILSKTRYSSSKSSDYHACTRRLLEAA